jgi:hypothetical protein
MSFTPSPELRFVFRAADSRCTADELLEIARGVQDWQRVARLAESEGATAVLWRLLRPVADRVPNEMVTFLQARTMLADFRMQRLAARAQETVAALQASGVSVLLLKGAAVGARFDPTFRQRPMTDVDLLIAEHDAERAKSCVRDCGWLEMPDVRLSELLHGHQHLPPFVDPTLEGLRLELHTRLLPPDSSFRFDAEQMWARSAAAGSEFAGARVPDVARLLVHTAVHFAWQHEMQFAPWRTLRSVSLLINSPKWDWQECVAIARDALAHTTVYWTLRMGRVLSGLDVPQATLAALAPPTWEPIRAVLDRHFTALADPLERPPSPSDNLTQWMWRLALRPQWSGLARNDRRDPERRWERAMGTLQDESGFARVRRHVDSRRAWWDFLSRTVGGR